MSAHPVFVPKLRQSTNGPSSLLQRQSFAAKGPDELSQQPSGLNEADLDRFATLFSPATPPATPTFTEGNQPPLVIPTRPRKSTQGSSDSDFGAFVSVPPSQDPLFHYPDHVVESQSYHVTSAPASHTNNHSLVYFDQFTASAKTAAERSRKGVLDELLHHQDDPMYFLNTHSVATTPSSSPIPPPCSIETSSLTTNPICAADPMPMAIPMSTDDALAEALASDMNTNLIRIERGGSIKVAPSPSRSRRPLSPRLSGSASPPSVSSPTGSVTSLPTASPPLPSSMLGSGSLGSTPPAHATLSRLSSSLVSLLPSTRPRSRATSVSTNATASTSAPSTVTMRFHTPSLTHGSPFASTPYIPPTGAPGFAGDRAWDRGFSEGLSQEEKLGLVDPVGLGFRGTDVTPHPRHVKAKGITLVGRREGTVKVLTEDMADLIRQYLPALIKLPRHWTLLYSLDQHGISLNTLYARCEPCIPSRAHPNPPKGGLLVIRDAYDVVFGAWLSEGIRLEKGGYYGSGEAFLWRYRPPLKGEREREQEGRLDVYKWTGANDYVALCEPGFISFGGGDGHYGLYLDASLLDGSSAPCPTFGNPPLCVRGHENGNGNGVAKAKGEVSFECVGLEVWGVGSG